MKPIDLKPYAATIAAVAAATGISVSVLSQTTSDAMISEGESLVAYADPARPDLATICFGETKGVKFGDKATHEECVKRLIQRMPDYILPVKALMPNIPDSRLMAYSDTAYNGGVGILTRRATRCAKANASGQCIKSVEIPGTSIVDMELAGYWQGACARLLVFTAGSGKHFNGLIARREKAFKTCMGEFDGQQAK